MIYINNNCDDPYYNLALEEYFLKTGVAGDYILMFWQNSPSVILGRYQNATEVINKTFIENNNIKVARRITGGSAVYYDKGNLNYSFIVPSKNSKVTFNIFTKPIIKALKDMGIKATFTDSNNLEIDGKKFFGNVQFIHKERTLYHGTLLFNSEFETFEKTLNNKKEKMRSVKSRVINLKSYFCNNIDIEQFKTKLIEAFNAAYGLEQYIITAEDEKNIKALVKNKYNTWRWTYREPPKYNTIRGKQFKNGYLEFRLQIEEGYIKEAYLYGDFFSSGNVYEIANKLSGIKYDRNSIIEELCCINFENHFEEVAENISLNEIVEIII